MAVEIEAVKESLMLCEIRPVIYDMGLTFRVCWSIRLQTLSRCPRPDMPPAGCASMESTCCHASVL